MQRTPTPNADSPARRGAVVEVSATITRRQVDEMVTPAEVISVLSGAGVECVLAGAYATNVWTGVPRATRDVDVIVPLRAHNKAVRAIRAAFPHLIPRDSPAVARFEDPASGDALIDLMKPRDRIVKAVFLHSTTASIEGRPARIVDLEMALALKFAAMVGAWRNLSKKYMDASDFIAIVTANEQVDLEIVRSLGELVYPGGGAEIAVLVADARAGRRLSF